MNKQLFIKNCLSNITHVQNVQNIEDILTNLSTLFYDKVDKTTLDTITMGSDVEFTKNNVELRVNVKISKTQITQSLTASLRQPGDIEDVVLHKLLEVVSTDIANEINEEIKTFSENGGSSLGLHSIQLVPKRNIKTQESFFQPIIRYALA